MNSPAFRCALPISEVTFFPRVCQRPIVYTNSAFTRRAPKLRHVALSTTRVVLCHPWAPQTWISAWHRWPQAIEETKYQQINISKPCLHFDNQGETKVFEKVFAYPPHFGFRFLRPGLRTASCLLRLAWGHQLYSHWGPCSEGELWGSPDDMFVRNQSRKRPKHLELEGGEGTEHDKLPRTCLHIRYMDILKYVYICTYIYILMLFIYTVLTFSWRNNLDPGPCVFFILSNAIWCIAVKPVRHHNLFQNNQTCKHETAAAATQAPVSPVSA